MKKESLYALKMFNRSKIVPKFGFTMSEILLSLTIIGVVAAITLPSLTGNINEKVWNTQRKALYARMSQAISLMPALNGYGIGATDTETSSNAAQAFVTQGLSKVLKINNICDFKHLADCGLPKKILSQGGVYSHLKPTQIEVSNINTLHKFNPKFAPWVDTIDSRLSFSGITNTNVAAFETANGESILTYYSPFCRQKPDDFVKTSTMTPIQPYMCVNFVYDLNGKKGPNAFGKDVGIITALYSTDSVVVAPKILQRHALISTFTESSAKCRLENDNSRVPTPEELAALFYNSILSGGSVALGDTPAYADCWSSKSKVLNGTKYGILLKFRLGAFTNYPATESASLVCIER